MELHEVLQGLVDAPAQAGHAQRWALAQSLLISGQGASRRLLLVILGPPRPPGPVPAPAGRLMVALCGAEVSPEAQEALCSAAFASLPVHTQLSSQRAVLACLQAGLAESSAFLKAFAAALVKQVRLLAGTGTAPGYGARVCQAVLKARFGPQDAHRAPQQALQQLAWSCAILRSLDLSVAAKAAARLVQRQVRSRVHVCIVS